MCSVRITFENETSVLNDVKASAMLMSKSVTAEEEKLVMPIQTDDLHYSLNFEKNGGSNDYIYKCVSGTYMIIATKEGYEEVNEIFKFNRGLNKKIIKMKPLEVKKVSVEVKDVLTGAPVSNVGVTMEDSKSGVLESLTDENGIAKFSINKFGEYIIKGKKECVIGPQKRIFITKYTQEFNVEYPVVIVEETKSDNKDKEVKTEQAKTLLLVMLTYEPSNNIALKLSMIYGKEELQPKQIGRTQAVVIPEGDKQMIRIVVEATNEIAPIPIENLERNLLSPFQMANANLSIICNNEVIAYRFAPSNSSKYWDVGLLNCSTKEFVCIHQSTNQVPTLSLYTDQYKKFYEQIEKLSVVQIKKKLKFTEGQVRNNDTVLPVQKFNNALISSQISLEEGFNKALLTGYLNALNEISFNSLMEAISPYISAINISGYGLLKQPKKNYSKPCSPETLRLSTQINQKQKEEVDDTIEKSDDKNVNKADRNNEIFDHSASPIEKQKEEQLSPHLENSMVSQLPLSTIAPEA